ncbi:hypothetical protein [Sorangium sp. So ce362]|uniref:hypothetical protein n=1 Tax=Sorangium sp. So ce362 TaxID=3133303 RepID=UPI003F5E413C
MRTTLLSARLASLVALAGASACGGNVVLDGSAGGDDGSGGAGASATSNATSSASAGPQTASSSGAGSAESVRASCNFFCDLFEDTACREPGCREACADLLSEPRPCNALAAPYFDCMGGIVHIGSFTTCEQISAWLDPLFECLGSRESACDAEFVYVDCAPAFKAHRECQLGQDR